MAKLSLDDRLNQIAVSYTHLECPRCGAMVSDKAKQCVHCGEVLIPEEKKYCMECGAELIEGMSECPNCGCPVEEQ